MLLVPTALVERLPVRLWRPANLHLGGRLHFCYGGAGERTVEWQGREVGQGCSPRVDEMERHGTGP